MHLTFVLRSLGVILLGLGGALLIPAGAALYYEEALLPYVIPASGSLVLGAVLLFTFQKRETGFGVRDGAAIVVGTWVLACVVGVFPFLLMSEPLSVVDALFESTSGFTTTGSTVFSDVESLPRGVLLWRSLSHWLGGMGIIVLAVAILPLFGIGGRHLMRAEAPGPDVERLSPRIAQTARIFWGIYVGITAIEVVLLVSQGVGIFDAVNHSFATVATGGFSTKNASIGAFSNSGVEWTVAAFMVLSGVNFSLYYRLLIRDFARVGRDSELKVYLAVFAISVALVIAALLSASVYDTIEATARYAMFQVATLMTSTGFATADYVLWPGLARGLLLLMLFVGGSVGSTSGGIKMFHVTILSKAAFREVHLLRHPRSVKVPRLNHAALPDTTIGAVQGFVFLYLALVLISTIVVAGSNTDLETALTATLAAIGNIGPGFAGVGPTENFAFFPDYVKVWLSMVMVAGRLEIYTVLILLTPSLFKKW
ncbi:MAG: TrkH family potassium uptake protein [Spirochaetota bacterium]